jgi:pimeloyl-ACP methyl ester carboxylesterase
MKSNKIPIYFIPGLAAGKEIFERLQFPKDQFDVHIISWVIPFKNETLKAYAQRMATFVKHDNAVLVGVSFGGVVAQEMCAFLNVNKLIIVSSVKNKSEMPRRLQIVSFLKLYKMLPVKTLVSTPDLTKYAIGPKSRQKLSMYNRYLSVRDSGYLQWAIKQMLTWDRKNEIKSIIHIHGNRDAVFPIKNIKNCQLIKDGTHAMILFKAQEVSQKIIENISKK